MEQCRMLRRLRERKGECGGQCVEAKCEMGGESWMRWRRLRERMEELWMRRTWTAEAGMRCGVSKLERWRDLEQRELRMREERMRLECWRRRMQRMRQQRELAAMLVGEAVGDFLMRRRELEVETLGVLRERR